MRREREAVFFRYGERVIVRSKWAALSKKALKLQLYIFFILLVLELE